ncbi:uncharacterized protein LOC111320666 isoform X1 [Stylophora pistillata]|uniref:uncharacterized protein LOC111320666 isoform X1 n=2 Tax=Stylophora pistillata TaxID=50429 RepID=UPI000C045376|nr:uncharacterized protein LOC111320666 isoform X1 [Stylophora pistillata]XP_022779059.1 uncharacterized protein LOC111320666 isoform X1 [Stylophora pistillata]XP_022779060.1 uncharacterized protein LOC111320666 isoform X1 [Stylophora pistillata]
MESTKIVFLVLVFITQKMSTATTATNSSTPRFRISHATILIKLIIIPAIHNATVQMKLLYPFITSSDYFYEPPITLGLNLGKDCTKEKEVGKKLSVLHSQLAVFKRPLNFVVLYVTSQGRNHTSLASVLRTMSVMVNATVSFIRYQMRQEGIWPPEYPVISEAQFNNITGTYLKTLVRRNLVTLTITDDVVKRLRNFVILYTLHDVLIQVSPCTYGTTKRKSKKSRDGP